MLSSLGTVVSSKEPTSIGQGVDQDYSSSERWCCLPIRFNEQRYWMATVIRVLYRKHNSIFQQPKKSHISLIGSKTQLCRSETTNSICIINRGRFSSLSPPPSSIWPGHYYPQRLTLEMAVAAGTYQFKTSRLVSRRPNHSAPDCILPEGRIELSPNDTQPDQITKVTNSKYLLNPQQQNQEEPEWVLHATGKIRANRN